MLNLIKRLFRIRKEKEKIIENESGRKNIVEPDFIDYDGMGNQGRFPETKNR